jgi:hypothetical protein
MPELVVAAFCARGPYRHVRELLAQTPDAWFPWGYRTCQTAIGEDNVRALRRCAIELWAVDDVREPTRAEFVAGGRVDFVVDADSYLAFTVRCAAQSRSVVEPDRVIECVREGSLLFEPNMPIVSDGSEKGNTAAQGGATIRETVAPLPLG